MNNNDAFVSGILPAQLAKPRLMVAEDDLGMRRFLEDLLEPLYAVETAADGEQAWSAMQCTVPALLLTDLQMPNLDSSSCAWRLERTTFCSNHLAARNS